jgi:hypothetical protein
VLVAALLGTSACVSLPDGGDIRAQPGDALPSEEGIRYLPASPAPGALPTEIVSGFLDAMLASPVQTSTAREFLTSAAAERWEPQRRVIVYGDIDAPSVADPGGLELTDTGWVDASGHWRGALPAGQRRIDLTLAREKGEWRIAAVPDALLARRSWFSREYGQFEVHFFDATHRVLVPEPVFVPRGGQLATALVRALLAGPPAGTDGVLVTRLGGLELVDGTVRVADGVARVDLTGKAALPTPEARAQLAAQLAWALRQVGGVATLQVRIDDTPLTLEGGLTDIPVSHGIAHDPAISSASDDLFGLREGRAVRLGDVPGDDPVEDVAAPWTPAYRLRDVSLDLDARRIAGVRADGQEVLVGPVDGARQEAIPVRGEDFAHPAWDNTGRAWLLDRRAGGAQVTVVVDGRPRVVAVPGVSGRSVTDLLVSGDGTRLVAAVSTGSRTSVLVSRLRWHQDGVEALPSRRIAGGTGLRDLAWDGPTEVVVLTGDGEVSRVRWVSLDGAPDDLRHAPPSDLIVDDITSVVGSATEGTAAWAVAASGALVGIGRSREPLNAGNVTMVTRVG